MSDDAQRGEPTAPSPSRPRRQRLARLSVVIVGVLVGLLFAGTLNDALGIQFQPKEVPDLPPLNASSMQPTPPLDPFAAVVVSGNGRWLHRAAQHLATALAQRTGHRPEIVPAGHQPVAGKVIRTVEPTAANHSRGTDRSFAVTPTDRGLTVSAPDHRGLVRGYYWLADQIVTGSARSALLGRHPEPELNMRLVDIGGLGVPTDPSQWDSTNYSHNTRRFKQAIGYQPPYVDEEAFARIKSDYVDYLDRMLAYGNNGIVQGGFLNLVTFDKVGDGFAVYDADSPYRARHEAISKHMSQLWRIADRAGMDVYLSHTELALTPPLKRYLTEHCGSLDAEDRCIWQVYQKALVELFEEHPAVDGIMVRVGEAGEIYDPDSGLAYSTRLAVRTDEGVRTMLRSFLDVAERYDADVIFRSWTVGIGEVGAMHTSAEVYQRVLGDIDSPHLVVSTKFVQGDFYRYLPFNETLYVGDQRRIVEMQDRREYEGFMAFPDLISPMHVAALNSFLRSDTDIAGVWQWTQNGGPQQAGPMSLYPFYGFWLNIDANVYTTSRLAADPDADPADVAADWIRRRFGDSPEVTQPLVRMLDLSRQAVRKGLYVGPFAKKRVLALGLQPPPMMWIFEWDIVSGSNSVLSVMYHLSAENVDAAIAEGRRAVDLAKRMRALVGQVPSTKVADPQLLAQLADSVDYEVDLLQTLAAWRATFLRYYQWLDTGDAQARAAWQSALEQFTERKHAHLARYGENLDFPAYNFFAVEQGLGHMKRNQTMTWLARGLLAVLLLTLVIGAVGWVRGSRSSWGTAPVALVRALVAPGRLTEIDRLSHPARSALVAGSAVWAGLALLVFSDFRSVHFPTLLGMMMVVFVGALALANRRAAAAVCTGVAAPLLVVGGAFMAVASVRGPGLFWLRFWTSPDFRTGFVTVCVTLLVWTVYAGYATARHHGRRHRSWAAGTVLSAAGFMLVAVGAVPAVAGLETMLTGFNNEMAILPLGLSKILGITTHLGIPKTLPTTIVLVGAVVVALGGMLLTWSAWRGRRPSNAEAADSR